VIEGLEKQRWMLLAELRHISNGTVTLIETCSGAVGFEAVATDTVGSFTFQAAASGAMT
jgi:hypothetical protein